MHVWAGKTFQPELMEITLWKTGKRPREDEVVEWNLQDELWTLGMDDDHKVTRQCGKQCNG